MAARLFMAGHIPSVQWKRQGMPHDRTHQDLITSQLIFNRQKLPLSQTAGNFSLADLTSSELLNQLSHKRACSLLETFPSWGRKGNEIRHIGEFFPGTKATSTNLNVSSGFRFAGPVAYEDKAVMVR
jgi:hypothetical protein